jgi:hypothetical protein
MPNPVHIVLTVPPSGVADEEYSTWYDRHVVEVLEIPGFVAARRYWLAPASPERPQVEYRHGAFDVCDRTSEEPAAELGRRIRSAEMTLPDWFGEIRVATFDGRPLEDAEFDPPDHGYLVLSHAPRRFTTEEYFGWYYAHARENLTSEGFDAVWRYALTPVLVDADALGDPTHAAFYEVHGELPSLRSALADSAQARRVDIPNWMPEGDFVSWDCLSAAPVITEPAAS